MFIITGRESLPLSVPLNLLAFRLARAVAGRGNMVCSPLTVAASLAFLRRVSAAETASELEQALTADPGLDIDRFTSYLEDITREIRNVEIAGGTRCWIDAAWADAAAVMAVNRANDIRLTDFNEAAAVASEVNAWIRELTRGVVSHILGPTEIPPQSRMLLCSALHFRASWFIDFPPAATTPGVFHGLDGDAPALMMQNTLFALYQSDDIAEYIEVPYAGAASFRIVLPGVGVDLRDVWTHLSTVPTFGRAGVTTPSQRIKLILPRFTLDWRGELVPALESIGVRRVFSADTADFSPIAAPGTLFVSDILHCATIRVCESGTEAGAVTMTMFTGSSSIGRPRVIEVNRPFIFDVVEHATGGILLCGQVTQASDSSLSASSEDASSK